MGRHKVDVSGPGIAAFLVCLALGAGASAWSGRSWPSGAGGLIGVYLLFALKVVQQWRR